MAFICFFVLTLIVIYVSAFQNRIYRAPSSSILFARRSSINMLQTSSFQSLYNFQSNILNFYQPVTVSLILDDSENYSFSTQKKVKVIPLFTFQFSLFRFFGLFSFFKLGSGIQDPGSGGCCHMSRDWTYGILVHTCKLSFARSYSICTYVRTWTVPMKSLLYFLLHFISLELQSHLTANWR